MATIQELLTALRQHTADTSTAGEIMAIVQAVMELETILVAFFPPTRHYFITHEQKEPTAVIFCWKSALSQPLLLPSSWMPTYFWAAFMIRRAGLRLMRMAAIVAIVVMMAAEVIAMVFDFIVWGYWVCRIKCGGMN